MRPVIQGSVKVVESNFEKLIRNKNLTFPFKLLNLESK